MEYPGLEGTQGIIKVQFLSQQSHPVLPGAVPGVGLWWALDHKEVGGWPRWEDGVYDALTAGGQAVSSELASHGSPAVWASAAGSSLKFDPIQLKSSTDF